MDASQAFRKKRNRWIMGEKKGRKEGFGLEENIVTCKIGRKKLNLTFYNTRT